MGIILGVIKESYFLLNKMSPYLLFGFLFAGILHVFVNPKTVAAHLGKNSFFSVIKASLFGIPLPLCSCGVIPAAMSLRKEGASKGATLSFLISTPTTSVDSIFATYSLLGPIFAVYRVIASFVTGVFSGIMANVLIKKDVNEEEGKEAKCKLCHESEDHNHTVANKIRGVFKYAFTELLPDVGGWLLAGIAIGGVISYFLPEEFIRTYLGSGWQAMMIMLLIGIPMYVCATGSIPIAAALMLKGMNPGAAFVFLLAGPATNAVSVTLVSKNLGRGALIIYISSIALCSVGLGVLLDKVWEFFQTADTIQIIHYHTFMPLWAGLSSSIVLVSLIGYSLFSRERDGRSFGN